MGKSHCGKVHFCYSLHVVSQLNGLSDLNTTMRQIDLCCKLFAPLFISFVDVWSTFVAIQVVLAMSVVSVTIEYIAVAQVSGMDQTYLSRLI